MADLADPAQVDQDPPATTRRAQRGDEFFAEGGALGCIMLLAIAAGIATLFIAPFRVWMMKHPGLAIAIASALLLAAFSPRLRRWLTRQSPQRRILLTTIGALTPAALVYSFDEVGIRLIFLLVVCLFPGLLFYLFVSSRRYSLLNEHLTHLHNLGLLAPRVDEQPDDTTRRLSSYLQEFQAIYGGLPQPWVDDFIAGKRRVFTHEDQEGGSGEMRAFASIISTETMVPVILTTTLVVLGWLWTLPPWHVEETLQSWEKLATTVPAEAAADAPLEDAEPAEPPAAAEPEETPAATVESGAEPERPPAAVLESEAEPEETSGAAAEPPAGEEEPPAVAEPEPEGPPTSASIRTVGNPLLTVALIGLQGAEPPSEAAWYKPWTWFRDDPEKVRKLAVEPDTGTAALSGIERFRRFQGALLPVMTPMTFAFLGAYFFSLQMLFRRFVRRDLGASAYVSCAMRIVLAWVATWVVVNAFGTFGSFDPAEPRRALLLAGFAVGVFPSVVWHILEVSTQAVLGNMFKQFRVELPIGRLDGLNIWHQTRLEEEDVENIPSMANATIVELLLHTRIPANRIIDWVDQAILYTHLGEEDKAAANTPSKALREHGILNATSLLKTYEQATARGDEDKKELEKILPGSGQSRIRSLVDAVSINPNLDQILHWRQASRPAPVGQESG